MNVLVFGDSIGLGLWDENGGWVGRLTEFLVKKSIASDLDEDYEIYNLGVSGDTTEGLVERFEFETRYRVGESETAIIFSAARAIFRGLTKNLCHSLVLSGKKYGWRSKERS